MAGLTQKEQLLLKDQQSHEKLCIAKYQQYAAQTSDTELAQLFSDYAQQEVNHLNTINKHLNQSSSNPDPQDSEDQSNQGQAGFLSGSSDAELCEDMLITEKYVSNTYDTAVFEADDSTLRQDLSHIQKEEQQHGEGIYNYMKNKGYYQA